MNITVFCGSSSGRGDKYIALAKELGKEFAYSNYRLVYGGASIGVMGAFADSILENKGEAIGVIPKVIIDLEVAHDGLTELVVVDDMHQRKAIMYTRADVFLVLPGGFGTLDEMCEALTWNQLQLHQKKLILFNYDGFYDSFFKQVELMRDESFLSKEHFNLVEQVKSTDELLKCLQSLGQ